MLANVATQHYSCVMSIPELDFTTGYLPSGIHEATWEELVQSFGTSEQRRLLLRGLEKAMDALRDAGCKRLYVDGSFVTSKPIPGDFDGCWEATGVDGRTLLKAAPSLLVGGREAQKAAFGGELFIADDGYPTFLEFFQKDRNGTSKGIVAINLTQEE